MHLLGPIPLRRSMYDSTRLDAYVANILQWIGSNVKLDDYVSIKLVGKEQLPLTTLTLKNNDYALQEIIPTVIGDIEVKRLSHRGPNGTNAVDLWNDRGDAGEAFRNYVEQMRIKHYLNHNDPLVQDTEGFKQALGLHSAARQLCKMPPLFGVVAAKLVWSQLIVMAPQPDVRVMELFVDWGDIAIGALLTPQITSYVGVVISQTANHRLIARTCATTRNELEWKPCQATFVSSVTDAIAPFDIVFSAGISLTVKDDFAPAIATAWKLLRIGGLFVLYVDERDGAILDALLDVCNNLAGKEFREPIRLEDEVISDPQTGRLIWIWQKIA